MDTVTERVKREQESYELGTVSRQCGRIHLRFRHVFECRNTQFGEQHMKNVLSLQVKGARVLDYGCAYGWWSVELLKYGPQRLAGIDISTNLIRQARDAAGDRAEFYVMDGHRLAFGDGTFDLVLGRSILHHLDFETAIREVSRVLKPGGYAVFAEPMFDNPMAKVYRFMTRKAHTPDEQPLSRQQIKWADMLFGYQDHVFCGFFSTGLGLITSLFWNDADNALLSFADKVDRIAMRSRFRYWMRYVYLVWRKVARSRADSTS